MPKSFWRLPAGASGAGPSGSVFAVLCGCEACRAAAVTFTPPAQFGAAEATCTCAGLCAAELKLDKRAELNPGDGSVGGRTWPGMVPDAVRMSLPGPPFA